LENYKEMVGRTNERKILDEAMQSSQSELIAIYGRRRIGKTYLIREHFAKDLIFSMSGLFDATLQEHLREFASCLKAASQKDISVKTPKNWFEAFDRLKTLIETHPMKSKKVIFLDEVPWMATAKSRFLTAFESFWNGWASARKDIVVIICGSAAAWMIQKIEKSKGGLYNRVTKRIVLKPFTLAETEAFFKSKMLILSRLHIVELYMMLGGVPHYLNQVKKGETPSTAIERIVFDKDGILSEEFENLFLSLFGQGGLHKQIVELLTQHRYGLTREDILTKFKVISSGWFTNILEELEASGFIEIQVPYSKNTKDARYKVVDNYSLFYVNFKKTKRIQRWASSQNTQQWKTWSGLTFENVCFYHKNSILKTLGITGVQTAISPWHHKGNDEMRGTQIDMVIDRGDKAINICEIKFNENPFLITKQYAQEMRLKMTAFNHFTKNRKTLFCTFITAGGLIQNSEANSLLQSNIDLDDLFD
jgi:uncharacterized protein